LRPRCFFSTLRGLGGFTAFWERIGVAGGKVDGVRSLGFSEESRMLGAGFKLMS
jgi:hypothetical protein